MPLVLILLAVLIGSFYYIVQAEGGWGELPRLMERVGINGDKFLNPKSQIRNNGNADETTLPNEYFSGKSRFSRGMCAKDSDCFVGGCSGEVCSSESDVITTCEYSENFPNKVSYSCGCVSQVCGWRNK